MSDMQPAGDREPGFLGMIAAGDSPAGAWEKIRAELAASPGARAIIDDLKASEEGRAALEYSRERWAAHGFPPPWEAAEGGTRLLRPASRTERTTRRGTGK